MRNRLSALLGIALAVVVAVTAIALADDEPADTGGLLPLVEEGTPEPDLSDVDLFVDGEPIDDGDTVSINRVPQETGGLTPLAPTDRDEPDLSDVDLFVEGEPVTPYDDSMIGELPETGGLTPLAPAGGTEPAPSDIELFIEGEPIT